MSCKKFDLIVSEMICMIRAGLWSDNAALPSEAELGAQYNASRETIRHAMKMLKAVNVISSRKGRGTFLAKSAPRLNGSIGVIVAGGAWRKAFETAMERLTRDKANKVCQWSVTDCTTGTEVDRIINAKGAAMRYAAYGACGVVWQVDASDVGAQNWASCRDEMLSIAAATGMRVVVVSENISDIRGSQGYDVVGSDWFELGRGTGRMLADSVERTVFLSIGETGASHVDSWLAGFDYETGGQLNVEKCRSDCGCLAVLRRSMESLRGSAFVFCEPGAADKFLLEAERQWIAIPSDVVIVQLGKAGFPPPVQSRIVTLNHDCNKIALASLKCIAARLRCPACRPIEILVPPISNTSNALKNDPGAPKGKDRVLMRWPYPRNRP